MQLAENAPNSATVWNMAGLDKLKIQSIDSANQAVVFHSGAGRRDGAPELLMCVMELHL